MYTALRDTVAAWMFNWRGREASPVVLGRKRIYILPSRQGYAFALTLAVMLAGSINYSLGLGFVLTFLLASLGVNTMVYTFRNLVNLRASAGRAGPVFAGETAHFTVHLDNDTDTDRHAVGLTHDLVSSSFVDIKARSTATATVLVPAPRRGIFRPGRLRIFTRFPLGLYYSWAYLELDMHCVVYPRPAPPGLPLPPATASTGTGTEHGRGQEDFAGLRQYHVGDSPRHIAWKAAARDQGLLTKQFAGRAETELWLDWDRMPAQMGVEDRLSRMARWVLDAHAAGLSYGLRLPGKTVEMAAGEAQRDRCLEALALHEQGRDS